MNHAELLTLLLPISYDPNGRVLSAEVQAEGRALDQAASHGDGLLAEADPRSTAELLSDWERLFGVLPATNSPRIRREAVLARLAARGGQSRAYLIALAKTLGYDITIEEFRPATVTSDVTSPLFSDDWRFVFRINVAANSGLWRATVMDTVADPLASFGDAEFESAMREDAPANTLALFAYQ